MWAFQICHRLRWLRYGLEQSLAVEIGLSGLFGIDPYLTQHLVRLPLEALSDSTGYVYSQHDEHSLAPGGISRMAVFLGDVQLLLLLATVENDLYNYQAVPRLSNPAHVYDLFDQVRNFSR